MINVFEFKNGEVLPKQSLSHINSHSKYWIDVSSITQEEAELLQKKWNIHDVTIEDFQNTHARVKIEEFSNYLYMVFFGLHSDKHLHVSKIDIILFENIILTHHHDPITSISRLQKHLGILEKLFKEGKEKIAHYILDVELDAMFPKLEEIDDDIERLEKEILVQASQENLEKIQHLKRKITFLKKIINAQREKFSFIAKQGYKQIPKKFNPYFRDLYDHSILLSETIETQRELLSATFDTYMMMVSNSTNEVMKTLSIITTIALPLTVISGIYGTNFLYLPGSNSLLGFWVMIGVMIGISVSMLMYFKKRNWY
jgi:magnesium transporter